MKKLNILLKSFASFGLVATSTITTVACGGGADKSDINDAGNIKEYKNAKDAENSGSELKFSKDFSTGYKTTADISRQINAGTPFGKYWMPKGQKTSELGYSDSSDLINGFLNYDPVTDKDAKYNVASVPLQERKLTSGSNAAQDKSGKVNHLAMGVVNKNTSGTPAQGTYNFDGYNFTNWSYVDEYTAWAGAVNEGIIVLPTADIIDAAHTNGTEMLGIIYFDGYHGLTKAVLEGFFEKDADGNYLVVDKLIEVADYFGFDGWFWNNEANANPGIVDEADVTGVMKQYSKKVKEIKKHQRIVMYKDVIGYGHELANDYLTNGADNYISDFGFSNGQKMEDLEDKTYAFKNHTMININSEWGTLKQGNYDFNREVKGTNGYSTSYASFAMADTYKDFATGTGVGIKQSLNIQKAFRDNDKNLFVGSKNDPSLLDESNSGIASIINERSPLIGEQFSTNFSTGNGMNYYENGKQIDDGQFIWNHRGVQDLLPTYQWIVQNSGGNEFSADFGYEKAFEKGNAINFSSGEWDSVDAAYTGGKLAKDGKTSITLFGGEMKISNQELSMKVSAIQDAIDLNTISEPGVEFNFELNFKNAGRKTIKPEKISFIKKSDNWYEMGTDLSAFTGDVLTEIGISFIGKQNLENVDIDLGQMKLFKTDYKEKVDFINDLEFEYLINDEDYGTSNIRMYWDKAEGDVDRYEIYRIDGDKYTILGTTKTNAFFLENIELKTDSKIAVKAVSKYNPENYKITIRGIKK